MVQLSKRVQLVLRSVWKFRANGVAKRYYDMCPIVSLFDMGTSLGVLDNVINISPDFYRTLAESILRGIAVIRLYMDYPTGYRSLRIKPNQITLRLMQYCMYQTLHQF